VGIGGGAQQRQRHARLLERLQLGCGQVMHTHWQVTEGIYKADDACTADTMHPGAGDPIGPTAANLTMNEIPLAYYCVMRNREHIFMMQLEAGNKQASAGKEADLGLWQPTTAAPEWKPAVRALPWLRCGRAWHRQCGPCHTGCGLCPWTPGQSGNTTRHVYRTGRSAARCFPC
jgi:hypothetical protein